jgi:hypothetical protein
MWGVPNAGSVWIYNIPPASTQLSIKGTGSPYYFGHSAAGIGDIDGDGRPDIAISATGGAGTKGFIHIFSGADLASGPKNTIEGTVAGEVLGDVLAGAWR